MYFQTARWVSILSGIFYGRYMQKKYTNMEKEAQTYEKPIRERANLMKKYQADIKVSNEMNNLAKEMGVPNQMDKPKKPDFFRD
ncbi:hypothetical protein KUTeg_005660 [Tegillarca granosa]|uniref:ATP synthase subunit e, mitochondrial n=1 Tax=Tegillarca granosa TaxID=220873 RepID=A0ABQ9FNM1_TEGGR|nr:hypothetical protein KUTeg_005660 [Tegillarca granosa]